MYIYAFNSLGEYIGKSERPLDPVRGVYAAINRNIGTDVPVPAYTPSSQIPVWKGAKWVVEPLRANTVVKPDTGNPAVQEPVAVIEVSMAQCRLALYDLHNIKSDEDFFALITELPDSFDKNRALLEFRTRPTVRKDNPLVIAICNIKRWDMNELFAYAVQQ